MNRSFLNRLVDAYIAATALESAAERAEFCAGVATRDPELAEELRILLAVRDDADSILSTAGEQISILLSSLGDSKREETAEELLLLLTAFGEIGPDPGSLLVRGFCFVEAVAVGATGLVFRGRDLRMQRNVAIKVLAPSIAREPQQRAVFIDEARLAGAIRHPNVVTIHHVSEEPDSDLVFYVMDWIEGRTLQLMLDERPLDLQQGCCLLQDLAQGLDAIHQRGVIHRDLKPGNIIVNTAGNAVIVDFGLALQGNTENGNGTLAGTPLYMSPEQLKGEPLSTRSDLFAFAEIACVLLTGRHPYPAESIAELTELVLQQRHSIQSLPHHDLGKILYRGLAADPQTRFPSAGEFARECLSAIRPVAATVTVPAFFSGIRAWYTTGILVCLAVFLLFSNEVLKWPGGQPHRAGSAESDPQPVQTVRGVWSDEDHFRNFLGMQFTRIPALAHLDLEWPPDPGHPEIFAGLVQSDQWDRNR